MPRATSQKISAAAHQPSAKGKERESTDVGGRNPLFNTERFGQHILKNPAVAQAYTRSLSPSLNSALTLPKNDLVSLTKRIYGRPIS